MDHSHMVIAERFRPALETLLTAFHYAEDSHTDRWQFAIGLAELEANGATLADLRWLILSGYGEHAREVTVPGDAERSFRKLTPTSLPIDSYFVLSATGVSHLRQVLCAGKKTPCSLGAQSPAAPRGAKEVADAQATPEWDSQRRELRYQGQVVKRYRVPAQNQELILATFQELGWPEFIDDPLPPAAGQDSKERLQATIKSLNRNQHGRLIRFHGNGNGQQVYWQDVTSMTNARLRRRAH
jgi:hypothetical protein